MRKICKKNRHKTSECIETLGENKSDDWQKLRMLKIYNLKTTNFESLNVMIDSEQSHLHCLMNTALLE